MPEAEPQDASRLADLLFDRPAATDADLLFGADHVAARADLVLHASLPRPTLAAWFVPHAQAELLAQLPPPTISTLVLRPSVPLALGGATAARLPGVACMGEVRYFTRTQRPTVARTRDVWQAADATEGGSRLAHQDARSRLAGWAGPWRATTKSDAWVEHRLPAVLVAEVLTRAARHQEAEPSRQSARIAQQEARRQSLERRGAFERATKLGAATVLRHQDGLRSRRASRAARWQKAAFLSIGRWAEHQPATPLIFGWGGRHQDARRPPVGINVVVVPLPPQPPACYTPNPHLRFAGLAVTQGRLLFTCDRDSGETPATEPVLVPVRRIYFVINHVSLHRVPDGTEVPVFNLSLSLDASSWAWGFEAVLPTRAEALVLPDANGPVELLASVNGTDFRVLAESISRERVFGDASIRVSGRGRNAVLAAPYAPVMTFTNAEGRSARQLMDDVLTLNGISLGWAVDWGLTDWNVPAGAFARQGTWIEALSAIAAAAGGYLLPHPSTQTLRVRHRYPAAPWAWASVTPDVVLPVDAVARESLRWVEKPAYNRVFVSGQDVGVLSQVTRTGTAGDVLAPMVVDPLITEAAVARQRGLAVLADTGKQIEVDLRMPVFAETGIIEPGTFVEYQDGSQGSQIRRLGIVRSTQIEAGLPEVWQTLGVQSHA